MLSRYSLLQMFHILHVLVWTSGCGGRLSITATPPPEEKVELAPFMGNLQRYSQKLGLAIEARNRPLTEFYLEEVDEVLEEVELKVPEDDGLPVAETSQKIMRPLLQALKGSLPKEEWPAIRKYYVKLIDGCNRCHAALEHEFIVILPAQRESPYNQDFTSG